MSGKGNQSQKERKKQHKEIKKQQEEEEEEENTSLFVEDPRKKLLADYDQVGVYVYQAYSPEISTQAVQLQKFDGISGYSFERMTWIKFSLGWMLYRSGYATKPGQERILRIKIPHSALSTIIQSAVSSLIASEVKRTPAVFQWDPDRDVRLQILDRRALQLGIRGELVQQYAKTWILEITDITDLAHEIRHCLQTKGNLPDLPIEKEYHLSCEEQKILLNSRSP